MLARIAPLLLLALLASGAPEQKKPLYPGPMPEICLKSERAVCVPEGSVWICHCAKPKAPDAENAAPRAKALKKGGKAQAVLTAAGATERFAEVADPTPLKAPAKKPPQGPKDPAPSKAAPKAASKAASKAAAKAEPKAASKPAASTPKAQAKPAVATAAKAAPAVKVAAKAVAPAAPAEEKKTPPRVCVAQEKVECEPSASLWVCRCVWDHEKQAAATAKVLAAKGKQTSVTKAKAALHDEISRLELKYGIY